MARYYFHYWVDHCLLADPRGSEKANAYAAFVEAFERAQDLSADLEGVHDWGGARIEIVDGLGRVLFSLPVSEAVAAQRSR
jgi:hypothetical protein